MASSSLGLGQNSNKRHRPYSSTSDDENYDSDLEYDEEEADEGLVLRNRDFYAQLEEEEKANSLVRREKQDLPSLFLVTVSQISS